VLTHPNHVERCQNWLSQNGHEGVEVRADEAFSDGVAVQDKQHTYRITNTLSSRLAKLEPKFRQELMKQVFNKGSA